MPSVMAATLSYLLGAITNAQRGGNEHVVAFEYARKVVTASEKPLQKLGLYERTLRVLDESEEFLKARRFEEADDTVLALAREMMEKSGRFSKWRKVKT